jgi:hypothetical protein
MYSNSPIHNIFIVKKFLEERWKAKGLQRQETAKGGIGKEVE